MPTRLRRAAASVAFVTLGLGPRLARASEDAPWGARTIAPGAALGFGYDRQSLAFQFGVGLDYYALPGFAIGLSFSDQILLYSNDLRARLPRVEAQIPTNLFRTTALGRFVFYRGRIFSPFVFAGLGPTVLNNGAGTFGHWIAGPGAYVHLTAGVYLDLGMNFEGMFPVERCGDAFVYVPGRGEAFRAVDDFCSFRWGPRLGLVVRFGGEGRTRSSDSEPRHMGAENNRASGRD